LEAMVRGANMEAGSGSPDTSTLTASP
jgi:hypothetical protein